LIKQNSYEIIAVCAACIQLVSYREKVYEQ